MADRYEPQTFEAQWRARWAEANLFKTRETLGAKKFYGLDFFPYPSGAGLSVGHARNYVPTDVICRMKAMQGYDVLHPMGFDAFGLPAENEAIKRKSHPAEMIARYAANYRRQMDLIGIGYDWERSFASSDPSYYHWTQWIFGLLYKRGLAYQKQAAVNWDPVDKTVLADEEIIGGRAERSGALVEKKWIPQWFFKITDYAERLLNDLDTIDWPEGIKNQQRNWIGRSQGVQFSLRVEGTGAPAVEASEGEPAVPEKPALSFDVFTTRIDTIFGMTFCVLAPEHALVEKLPVSPEDRDRISAYQQSAKTLSDVDRTATNRAKTGVFTGAYATNPANGNPVPIWLADYVLATYGTGAIMAVPAHDSRDFEFALQFGLPIVPVIEPTAEYLGERKLADYLANPNDFDPPFEAKDGFLINSGEYTGVAVAPAQLALGEWIEALGIGKRITQYKLRDWLISRQRYWGCPIPIIHSKDGELQLVPDKDLPVELPEVENYEPSGDGTSPLAHIPEFVNVTDLDGRLGRRETDTMGGFACSSWYFLRFIDPDNHLQAFDPAKAAHWMPVDCYVGGAEHAVMHLLYARFWTKVLFDEGLVPVSEPFKALHNQGQVLGLTPYRKPREGETLGVGEDGILVSFEEAKTLPKEDLVWRWARMSKSKGNVVTPDEMVAQYGADALRLYLLFKAPFHADIEWENKGVEDLAKFLNRVFRITASLSEIYVAEWRDFVPFEPFDDAAKGIRRLTHQTIRNCTDDIDRFGFNTYVSWLMKYVNGLSAGFEQAQTSRAGVLALSEARETLILLLSPGAPHSADELWQSIGKEGFTYEQAWPISDAGLAAEDEVTIAVQVNGKLRETFSVGIGVPEDDVKAAAAELPKVQPWLEGKTIRKVVYVSGKLVNFVAN
jgi:leucyl-tRNA synthetase